MRRARELIFLPRIFFDFYHSVRCSPFSPGVVALATTAATIYMSAFVCRGGFGSVRPWQGLSIILHVPPPDFFTILGRPPPHRHLYIQSPRTAARVLRSPVKVRSTMAYGTAVSAVGLRARQHGQRTYRGAEPGN